MIAYLLAGQSRDVWEWGALALGWAASLAALVAFVPWALERRRRPEFRIFGDLVQQDGTPRSWPTGHNPMAINEVLHVRIGNRNVGDTVAKDIRWNFVAPTSLHLSSTSSDPDQPRRSTDKSAGVGPDYSVTYLVGQHDFLAVGDFLPLEFSIVTDSANIIDAQARLKLDISEPRLNATGRRWLPSLADPEILQVTGEPASGAGTTWPPEHRRRRPQRLHAIPLSKLKCQPGSRTAAYDIVLAR